MNLFQGIKTKIDDARAKYHAGIADMPMWNWIMVHEKRNTKYCRVAQDYNKVLENLRSQDVFDKMMSEFFDRFGFHSEYINFMKDQRRILMKRIDAYITGNKTLLTIAEIDELSLKNKYERLGKNTDFYELAAVLEQEIGVKINLKEITVLEFYTHMKVNHERNAKLKTNYRQWQRR